VAPHFVRPKAAKASEDHLDRSSFVGADECRARLHDGQAARLVAAGDVDGAETERDAAAAARRGPRPRIA